MANPEVSRRTATQIATLGIGTPITAGGLGRATFIDVLAPSAELFILEASRTHTLVTPQGVVAGGASTDVRTEAFIFICRENKRAMCVSH